METSAQVHRVGAGWDAVAVAIPVADYVAITDYVAVAIPIAIARGVSISLAIAIPISRSGFISPAARCCKRGS